MTPTSSEWGYITCLDCGREFDLTDGPDADEWHHGHDCEDDPRYAGPEPAHYPDRCRVRLPDDPRAAAIELDRIAAYLPATWAVSRRPMGPLRADHYRASLWAVISGEDRAGWTLGAYVLPRLASGGIFPEPMPGRSF